MPEEVTLHLVRGCMSACQDSAVWINANWGDGEGGDERREGEMGAWRKRDG